MMNQKLFNKVLATMLVITLTCANLILLGTYASNSYATTDSLENQKTQTNNENVEFDAYFVEPNGKSVHTVSKDINSDDAKLYLSINVKKGYLKNAKIQMQGEDKKLTNFKISNVENKLEMVEGIDANTNTISLKQLSSGTQLVLQIPITSLKDDAFDLSNFSKINNITLNGTYTSDDGKNININKKIDVKVEWNGVANVELEQALKTYIPFSVEENSGTILQTIITSKLENNNLPVEQTNINIEVPVINGIKPSKVNVTSLGTYATNGDNGSNFVENTNWNYSEETGILNIIVANQANDDKVIWNKDAKDQYIVTYIYDEKIDEVKTSQKIDMKVKAYNNVLTEVTATNTMAIEPEQIVGNFIEASIQTNDVLTKGHMYNKSKKEVSYNEKVQLQIAYAELLDKIELDSSVDKFINEKEEESLANNTYYKTTQISKENFDRILGEEGFIKIISVDGEQLAIFTNETEADENGNYVYEYAEDVNSIKIEISKPVQAGILELNHVKNLSGNTEYAKNKVAQFNLLRVNTQVVGIHEDVEIVKDEKMADIKLIAPTTKIEASISNPNLSTVIKNENVELRVILKTNDITCDLFKNPIVEIVLPKYIKTLEIKDINLLFNNELKIKNYETYKNENGNIVIKVTIQGEDTIYNTDEISKGANLVINTDITIENLTPTTSDVMKVYVKNENVTTYERLESEIATVSANSSQKGYTETALKAVAPTGIVTINEVKGYNEKNETVTSISGEQKTAKLDVNKSAKTATINMDIINNYENKINNISILGRIPFNGNKNVSTNEDLASNLTLAMSEKISVTGVDASKVTIYYSENGEATKDLTLANGWKTEVTDLSKIKSYLIVLNDFNMETGSTIGASYKIAIPENISHNLTTSTNYMVYFNNVKVDGEVGETAVSPIVQLSTGAGPELDVKMTSDIGEGANVEEGKTITYTVTVKNVGKEEVKNINVSGLIPENTVYLEINEENLEISDNKMKNYTENIEKLEVGESKQIEYKVKTNILNKDPFIAEEEKITNLPIEAVSTVKVAGYDTEFTSNKVTNNLIEGYIDLTFMLQNSSETTYRNEEEIATYILTVENANNYIKENIKVYCKVPEGLTYLESNNDNISYDKNTNTLIWNIDKLDMQSYEVVMIDFTIDELKEGIFEKTIENSVTLKANDKELKASAQSLIIKKASLGIELSSSTKSTVSVGNDIIYNIKVENLGKGRASDVLLETDLQEGLQAKHVQYVLNGETYEKRISGRDVQVALSTIEANDNVDIQLTVEAQPLSEGETKKEVTSTAKVTALGINGAESNSVTHTIIPASLDSSDDPSIDTVEEGTYSISGIAWVDSNNNGKQEDDEPRMSGIEVMLINSESGQIVKDITTGKEKKQNTNASGEYIFANLKAGNYMVIFLYDTTNYGLALYKQDGVIDNKNSDVVAMNITYGGTTRLAAVSDKLTLSAENISNIDMGLVNSAKFDLSLEKLVTKIIENNPKETKEHNYSNGKLVKLDIPSKTMNSTTIIVEYKIIVKNEGNVPGYAKKIVDYMPKDMKFSSELNKDWYADSNGNLYNASLANTVINPGETKELTLLLTKKMDGENTGNINNNAEIYESYNEQGLQDIDSTVANNVQNEDDRSSADAIIGVRTGEVYVYIILTTTMITVLAIGIYFIKKKVLTRV